VDDLDDVAPAGPATAHAVGIVLINRNNQVRVAHKKRATQAKKPGTSGFSALTDEASAFMPYARGPAILGSHAYFIAKHKLLRCRIDAAGEAEVLATDAREGTRVSALNFGKVPVISYIATREGDIPAHAKLWIEGGKSFVLSPDGAGASSVAITQLGDEGLAVSIDARTAMTPLHGRRFRVQGANVQLEPDVVMWVGASSQSLSEVTMTNRGSSEAWALLPIEKDVTHFGLAALQIGNAPRMDVPVRWRAYPNGLDVAPVASANFCGKTYVAYARPSEVRPGSPSVLELAELSASGLGTPMILANARAFSSISLAPVSDGAALAFVADRRTWARAIRCAQ
jgi:hypothetical protein